MLFTSADVYKLDIFVNKTEKKKRWLNQYIQVC